MIVGIIGAGASGMAAALAAAEDPQVQVVLLERQARVGRKLLATGNGRCNLSNLHADHQGYHGADPDFARIALGQYSVTDTLEWFSKLGLYTVAEHSGRVYPYSDQANSVVDVLRFALEKPNVRLVTGAEVTRVRKVEGGFAVEAGEGYTFDKLIVACGGLAGTKLGGSMSGYKLLRGLGHKVSRLRPTLVQLKSSWSGCVSLKGVRANCRATILQDEKVFAQSVGELQFTEYGISGPVIFEISRDVCQGPGQWKCVLDLLPELSEEQVYAMLSARKNGVLTCEDLFTGILHNRLGRVITGALGIRGNLPVAQLSQEDLRMLCRGVKAFDIALTEPLGMDAAQVTAGGVLTEEFDPNTLESRLVPGLYACGEVLDIDGDCGGYNLQWAWSSGRLAGCSARGGQK